MFNEHIAECFFSKIIRDWTYFGLFKNRQECFYIFFSLESGKRSTADHKFKYWFLDRLRILAREHGSHL